MLAVSLSGGQALERHMACGGGYEGNLNISEEGNGDVGQMLRNCDEWRAHMMPGAHACRQ